MLYHSWCLVSRAGPLVIFARQSVKLFAEIGIRIILIIFMASIFSPVRLIIVRKIAGEDFCCFLRDIFFFILFFC